VDVPYEIIAKNLEILDSPVRSVWRMLRWVLLILFAFFLLMELVAIKDTPVWDLLDLLIVPFVLAVGAFLLNKSERESDRNLAEKRAESEQKIAAESRNQATLEAYLDRMTELLLKEGLRESKEDDEVRSIARAQTLTVLRNLDSERKGYVVQFLHESNLIQAENPIINLQDADLSSASLVVADLSGANLHRVNLRGADLRGVNLRGAFLSHAFLRGVDLRMSDLSEANLRWANLSEADLLWADLSEVDLFWANLSDTNLTETKNTTPEQLFKSYSLEGATMPDGRPYEEWIQDHQEESQPETASNEPNDQ
jgi:uncharacterized protein YjbI with pentapeptide repeats